MPLAGNLSIKERKCITPENVFVAELEILNDQREEGTFDPDLATPDFKRSGEGAVTFTAITNAGGIAREVAGKKEREGWPVNGSGWLAAKGDIAFGKGIKLPP